MSFRLESIVKHAKMPSNSTIYCSPTAKNLRLYGDDVIYMKDTDNDYVTAVIDATYYSQELFIKKLISASNPVFACSEISMLAHNQGIGGYDTMQVTIEKIVREL